MRRWPSSLILLVLAACGRQGRSSPDAGDRLGDQRAVCNWPASADTYDSATHAGCSPSAAFNICEVPNGSTVHADGGRSIIIPNSVMLSTVLVRSDGRRNAPPPS